MTTFVDRMSAGSALSVLLVAYRDRDDVVILGLPRGGVPVAAEVANHLRAPLDVLLVRKLGAPGQPELAMGAVASGGAIVVNENILAPLAGAAEVRAEIARQLAELRRRESLYRNDRLPLDIAGRIVILVDDGAATGASMLAAIRATRKLHAQRVVVALPVASEDALLALRREADEVICVLTPAIFRCVGDWYQDFTQTTDAQVVSLLASARTRHDRRAASLRTTSDPLRE